MRETAVAAMVDTLAKHEPDVEMLNGALVGDLVFDLKATEAAEVIERAFAAGVVDPMSAGTWRKVRHELGVEGLGLVDEEAEERETRSWQWVSDRGADGGSPAAGTPRAESTQAARKAKKAERKNRKRGRKQQKRKRR